MPKEQTPTVQTFIVDCPVCNAKVAATEAGRAQQSGFIDEIGEPYGQRLLVGPCPRCSTLLAAESHQTQFKGWEGDDEDKWSEPIRIFPNPPKVFSSHRIPRLVKESLSEADRSLQAGAHTAACVMFGRALEALCRHMLTPKDNKKADTTTKPLMLASAIQQLRDKKLIDGRLFEWSQHLRVFRNQAAHPSDLSISREDAEDLQTFVHAITEYIYDLTERYQEFLERQERRTFRKKTLDSF
jgi:hypothetical protein